MDSRVPVAGCAPLMIISIDSSSEGLSLTWMAKERQQLTYSPNGSWGLYRIVTRSSRLGIKSRLKEYCLMNAWERSFQVWITAMSREVNHLSVGLVRLF